MSPREYRVQPQRKKPLLEFIVNSLKGAGCRILSVSPPSRAPFRLVFETPEGERLGLVAYAFHANSRVTTNRPEDEARFQVKYGSKDGEFHEIWQDPNGLYVTVFLGIDPALGVWVAADPVLHNPTKMFISIEFKRRHAEEARRHGWVTWERESRLVLGQPIETMIAGNASAFLQLVRFERAALGLDPGNRMLLASNFPGLAGLPPAARPPTAPPPASEQDLHELERQFELPAQQIMDLIQGAPRLRMAVRGWVAEEHLFRHLSKVDEISDLQRIEADGRPDFQFRYRNGSPRLLECKNVLRVPDASGRPRLDFQRTRASIADPCSRFYSQSDFEFVAACLHPITAAWEFRFSSTATMASHRRCPGRLDSRVLVDGWADDIRIVLEAAGAQ